MNSKHIERTVCIKKLVAFDADEGIAPVTVWLSCLNGVTTRYSCEGDESTSPYVIFSCDNMDSLSLVSVFCNILFAVEGLRNPVTLRMQVSNISHPNSVVMEFSSPEALDAFKEILERCPLANAHSSGIELKEVVDKPKKSAQKKARKKKTVPKK